METKERTDLSKSNPTPKNRNVNVIVKAKELFAKRYPPNESEIDKYTALVDDSGFSSRYGESNRDYETLVFMNKQMSWGIELSSPNDEDRDYAVALEYVNQKPTKGNPEFFKKNPINVSEDGKVHGIIARNPKLPNKDDSYTIHFTISHGKETRDYPLDPKLRISVKE